MKYGCGCGKTVLGLMSNYLARMSVPGDYSAMPISSRAKVDDATARCIGIAKKYERDKAMKVSKEQQLSQWKLNAEEKASNAKKKEKEAIEAAAAAAAAGREGDPEISAVDAKFTETLLFDIAISLEERVCMSV